MRRNGHETLPADGRTLMGTLREVDTRQVEGGEYKYLGVRKGIEQILSVHEYNENTIRLFVNVDGLPIHKSNSLQVWPIL